MIVYTSGKLHTFALLAVTCFLCSWVYESNVILSSLVKHNQATGIACSEPLVHVLEEGQMSSSDCGSVSLVLLQWQNCTSSACSPLVVT